MIFNRSRFLRLPFRVNRPIKNEREKERALGSYQSLVILGGKFEFEALENCI